MLNSSFSNRLISSPYSYDTVYDTTFILIKKARMENYAHKVKKGTILCYIVTLEIPCGARGFRMSQIHAEVYEGYMLRYMGGDMDGTS